MREIPAAESRVEHKGDTLLLQQASMCTRIGFVQPSVIRVTCTTRSTFLEKASRIVVDRRWHPSVVTEFRDNTTFSTDSLRLIIDRSTGAMRVERTDGVLVLKEPLRARSLAEKDVYRNEFEPGAKAEVAESIDGARSAAVPVRRVIDRKAYGAILRLHFAQNESIYGLGSHEEGYGNLRGRTRALYQHNMKAVVPMLTSTLGYGILMDCGSRMTFRDTDRGATWSADVVDELDYYILVGNTFDEVTRAYHRLTGPAPLLPKWALGYLQSKERYVTGEEMVAVVKEYRRRKVSLDGIILDWKSWPNGGGWGQKSLDPLRFPEPESLARELRELGAHWMTSIWPTMTGGCDDQRELLQQNGMLGDQSTYNAFDAEARSRYWNQARRGLFDRGVDAWWCDCTEPFEADWSGALELGPEDRMRVNTAAAKLYLDEAEINTYSLEHSRGMYEGQRATTNLKRVLNLTRSAYAGQHRYGTVTWNGDVCARWDVLRASIAEGCNFTATGEPYWTVDIGGFFVDAKPDLWFWKGDYTAGCRGLTAMDAVQPDPEDNGCTDLGFWELYTRWLQYAVFLPMFRSHGTDASREIWRFGDEGSPFYDAIAASIRLRYELLPYFYSLMAGVTYEARMMMRPLGLEFPNDAAAHQIQDQFMVGHEFLVCPVTRPMYFTRDSQPIEPAQFEQNVYLPAGSDWFDFRSGALHQGAQWISVSTPLDRMPLFVRGGSIIPLTEAMQYVDERKDAPFEIRVYTGNNVRFLWYDDEGDGYSYEGGVSMVIELSWDEGRHILHFSDRQGFYPGMSAVREVTVVVHEESGRTAKSIIYRGEAIDVPMLGESS